MARPSEFKTHSLLMRSVTHSLSPRTHSFGRGVPVAVEVAVVSVVSVGKPVEKTVVVVVATSVLVVDSVTIEVANVVVVSVMTMEVNVAGPPLVAVTVANVEVPVKVVPVKVPVKVPVPGPGFPLVQNPSTHVVPGRHSVSGPHIAFPFGPVTHTRFDVSVMHSAVSSRHSSGRVVAVAVAIVEVVEGTSVTRVVEAVVVVTTEELPVTVSMSGIVVVKVGVIVTVVVGTIVTVESVPVAVGVVTMVVVKVVLLDPPGFPPPLVQSPSRQVVPGGQRVSGPQTLFPFSPTRQTRFELSVTHSCVPRIHSSGGKVAVAVADEVEDVVVGGPGSHCPLSSLHSKPAAHS